MSGTASNASVTDVVRGLCLGYGMTIRSAAGVNFVIVAGLAPHTCCCVMVTRLFAQPPPRGGAPALCFDRIRVATQCHNVLLAQPLHALLCSLCSCVHCAPRPAENYAIDICFCGRIACHFVCLQHLTNKQSMNRARPPVKQHYHSPAAFFAACPHTTYAEHDATPMSAVPFHHKLHDMHSS